MSGCGGTAPRTYIRPLGGVIGGEARRSPDQYSSITHELAASNDASPITVLVLDGNSFVNVYASRWSRDECIVRPVEGDSVHGHESMLMLGALWRISTAWYNSYFLQMYLYVVRHASSSSWRAPDIFSLVSMC